MRSIITTPKSKLNQPRKIRRWIRNWLLRRPRVFRERLWRRLTDQNRRRKKSRSWSDRLYEARHSWIPWFLVVLLGGLLFGGVFVFVVGPAYTWYLIEQLLPISIPGTAPSVAPGELAKNNGIWTFLLALLAAPIAWYLWLIRDRNRLAEFTNTRLGELRKHFYELQEWATDNTNPARQSTALFQLRGFLTGDRRLVPDELSVDRKRFAKLAREFFEMLLKNPELWDTGVPRDEAFKGAGPGEPGEKSAEESSADLSSKKRSPVQATLEAILITDGFRLKDLRKARLAGFQLSYARLAGVRLDFADLCGTNLIGAKLSKVDFYCADLTVARLYSADLNGAELRAANLHRANLNRAKLERVNFYLAELDLAKLNGAILNGANFQRAKLFRAELTGASLCYAELDGVETDLANLNGARIQHKWKSQLSDYTGTPIWLDDETGKPLDPQPTD